MPIRRSSVANVIRRGAFTDDFEGTQNPLSGAWASGGLSTGLDWSDAQKSGGIAFGTTNNSDNYRDSINLLSGFSQNQQISGVTSFTGSRSAGTQTHEVELILRGSYGPHTQTCYEFLWGYSGAAGASAQIMKHSSVYADFVEITGNIGTVPDVYHGAVVRARIVGSLIQVYIDEVFCMDATDTQITVGQPGIGFFWRGTENINDYGWQSIAVIDL